MLALIIWKRVKIYLGERLAEENLVALLDEISNGESVLEDIT